MHRSLAAVAVVTALVATSAHADTVTVAWHSPIINPGPGDTVSISHDSGAHYQGVYAGRFVGSVTATTPAGLDAQLVDDASNLFAYCYDILEYIGNATYTVDYDGPNAAAWHRTLDWLGAVNYVMNGSTNSWTDPFAWLKPLSSDQGAAIQLGIWESLYDTGTDWSMTTGAFRASGLNTGANSTTAWYASFRSARLDAGVDDLPDNLVAQLVNAGKQDVLVGVTPLSYDVPEPASLALVALSLGLAGAFARRRA